MPVQGPQTPGFWLPGTEYLSLAPNTSIALQGRRSRNFRDPATGFQGIPAGSVGFLNNSFLIETPWTNTSGIYLHNIIGKFFPNAGDDSGEIQVIGFSMGFGQSATPAGTADIIYPVGGTPSVLVTPNVGNIISQDQEKLITAQDITNFGEANSGQLNVGYQIGVKNLDATNTHSFAVILYISYARLDGIQV